MTELFSFTIGLIGILVGYIISKPIIERNCYKQHYANMQNMFKEVHELRKAISIVNAFLEREVLAKPNVEEEQAK